MKSIQGRLTLLYFVFGGIIAVLCFKVFENYELQADLNEQLGLGYAAETNVAKLRKLRTRKKATLKLKELRPQLSPDTRAKAISDIITASNEGPYGRLLRAISHFEKVEKEFNFKARPLEETIRDTINWIKEHVD